MSWGKVIAWLGVAAQLLNLGLGLLSQITTVPGFPSEYQANALTLHFWVAGLLGLVQAFLKNLRDDDGNGTPDLFDFPKKPTLVP